jgi:hypothetical protein
MFGFLWLRFGMGAVARFFRSRQNLLLENLAIRKQITAFQHVQPTVDAIRQKIPTIHSVVVDSIYRSEYYVAYILTWSANARETTSSDDRKTMENHFGKPLESGIWQCEKS